MVSTLLRDAVATPIPLQRLSHIWMELVRGIDCCDVVCVLSVAAHERRIALVRHFVLVRVRLSVRYVKVQDDGGNEEVFR